MEGGYKMDISLEKIDAVIARTAATFKEAKEALEKTEGGDVVEAIILIEESRKSWTDNISYRGEQMIDKVKEILRKGNVTRISVKKRWRNNHEYTSNSRSFRHYNIGSISFNKFRFCYYC